MKLDADHFFVPERPKENNIRNSSHNNKLLMFNYLQLRRLYLHT